MGIQMRIVRRGKTKDVFERDDGNYEFLFKDEYTGYLTDRGPVIEPGHDSVVGKLEGKGAISCRFTKHFFEILRMKGIPTHYIKTIGPNRMVVEPAQLFSAEGLYNLEFVFRRNACGSFLKRYPFVKPCRNLNNLVEIYTKGEVDQLITDDTLIRLNIMSSEEVSFTKILTQKISDILAEVFERKGLHLVDGKIELGKIGGKIKLIDDISPDVLRVCKGAKLDDNGDCMIHKECIRRKIESTEKGVEEKIEARNVLKPRELYNEMFRG